MATGPAGLPDRRSVREALLDAAYDAVVRGGWARIRMADVAAAAGVSRQTLYDQFGSREGLAAHLAVRETERFLDGTEAALEGHGDPVRAVEALVRFALATARDNPLVRAILTNADDGLLPLMTTRAGPVVMAACDRMVGYFAAYWPGVPRSDAQLVAEVTTRLTLSYIVLPGDEVAGCAERVARLVGRLLESEATTLP